MSDLFDPYYKWLGIAPEEQPPNHYRLLGLRLFEADPEVISNAAEQRMAHVRTYQLARHSALSQKILNELAAAKLCLLIPAKKAEYDGQLRSSLCCHKVDADAPPAPPTWQPSPPSYPGDLAGLVTISRATERPRRKRQTWLVPTGIAALPLVFLGLAAFFLKGDAENVKPSGGDEPYARRAEKTETADTPPKMRETGIAFSAAMADETATVSTPPRMGTSTAASKEGHSPVEDAPPQSSKQDSPPNAQWAEGRTEAPLPANSPDLGIVEQLMTRQEETEASRAALAKSLQEGKASAEAALARQKPIADALALPKNVDFAKLRKDQRGAYEKLKDEYQDKLQDALNRKNKATKQQAKDKAAKDFGKLRGEVRHKIDLILKQPDPDAAKKVPTAANRGPKPPHKQQKRY